MSRISKYLGFIVLAWSSLIILYCARNTPNFDLGSNVISDLGSATNVASIFNISVLLTGIVLFYFVNYLARYYSWSLLTRILLSLAGIGLILVGLFPVKYPLVIDLQRYYHWSGAALFFLGLPVGMISANLKRSGIWAKMQIAWGFLAIILPLYVFFFTEYRGYAELLSIVMNSVWLLVLSFIIITNRKVK